MAEIEVEVRKWGNSLGILLPSDVVKAEGLKVHDKALVKIMKIRYPDRRSFGFLKAWKVDAQKVKNELRREHEW